MWDIIPDIHGQWGKLAALLDQLGYRNAGGWKHSEGRRLLFLGDLIDRGPENGMVIRTVRDLVEADRAVCIMGNHELNAVHFHNLSPRTGKPVRRRDDKNTHQHASFLAEFPLGGNQTADVIGWMAALPLWLDLGPLRAVHACWHAPSVAALPQRALELEELMLAGHKDHALFKPVDTLAKGPEILLPDGFTISDKQGIVRKKVRLAWWEASPETWQDASISVPEGQPLPDGAPELPRAFRYDAGDPPVFFGHYWLTGTPALQARNALCMDYSAGADGPLLAYRWQEGPLDLARIVSTQDV
ncbi:MAG: metallophosphoesterase [Pseudomonadota bacterium]